MFREWAQKSIMSPSFEEESPPRDLIKFFVVYYEKIPLCRYFFIINRSKIKKKQLIV